LLDRGPASEDDGVLFDPLCLEVTASNHMTEERLARIGAQGAATLEIDLSITGGRATREEFRQLIVDDIEAKRWLSTRGSKRSERASCWSARSCILR
jgi:hypothetical protein